jgi:hypothetical protein
MEVFHKRNGTQPTRIAVLGFLQVDNPKSYRTILLR